MSKTKAVLDEYLHNESYLTQSNQTNYVPSDYCVFKSATNISSHINKRLSTQLKAPSKPCTRMYYVPRSVPNELSPDTYNKHAGVSKPYMYQKFPHSYYYLREQNTNPDYQIRSAMYLKYPRTMAEVKLSRYYNQFTNNCGDSITDEQDFYSYDDPQSMEYYERDRKMNYDSIYVQDMYYDNYIHDQFSKKTSQASKQNKISNSDYYTQCIAEEDRTNDYFHEDEQMRSKYYCREIPQKIECKQKYFVEALFKNKNLYQKSGLSTEFDPEVSTIFKRNNVGSTNKTCTVSAQTSDQSLMIEIKECFSQGTQTLELDFTDRKKKLASFGTQTERENKTESATNTEENKIETSNYAESVIRWTRRIVFYLISTMYNVPNLEQIAFFDIPQKQNRIKDMNSSFSQLSRKQKTPTVREVRPRKQCKYKRNVQNSSF